MIGFTFKVSNISLFLFSKKINGISPRYQLREYRMILLNTPVQDKHSRIEPLRDRNGGWFHWKLSLHAVGCQSSIHSFKYTML